MAANKFATMLHRNTNKMTLILIYAVLEWILIILLLLNSLFSYLIIKFADYFGLKTPCLWCSRIDHIFEPTKNKNLHRDLLCEAHATEISKLDYCSNHQKVAESQDLCEDCSSSRPGNHGVSTNLDFFPWVKEIAMIQSETEKVTENGEMGLKCSCCGVSLEKKIYSPYIVIKPSWGVLDYTQKGNLITEGGDGGDDDDDNQIEEFENSDRSKSDTVMGPSHDDGIEDKGENQMVSEVNETEMDCSVSVSNSGLRELECDEDDKVGLVMEAEQESIKENNSSLIMGDLFSGTKQVPSIEIHTQHLEFFVGHDGYGLIPVELFDLTPEENSSNYRIKEEDDENYVNVETNLGSEWCDEARNESIVENKSSSGEIEAVYEFKEAKFAVLESMEIEENENSLIFHAKECDLVREVYELVEPQTTSKDAYDGQETAVAEAEETDSVVPAVTEDTFQLAINENEREVSIGTEIPDLEPTDEFQNQEILSPFTCINEDSSTSFDNFNAEDDQGSKQAEEESVKLKTISVEVSEHAINNQTSLGSELNEIEEEKVPDTPTSIESLHHLHKKLLMLEKKETGTEESLDGSVLSEFEGGEGILTVERFKSVLKAERKALHLLYTELEEERSASAVAANQTMAMINRLQEEKAAMQMEALQYQRMMEEQSEYDQEALQLLNELMVKKEKEKQELEKELEVYRKKVLEYEAKERMRMLRKSKDGSTRSESSFLSSSIAGDSDGLSIDLNQDAKEEEDSVDLENGNHNTPVDAVLNLEESLSNFEEERMSILEHLKVLEEKLFTLDDEEEQQFEDVKPIEHFYEENGKHLDGDSDFGGQEANGVVNGVTAVFRSVDRENRKTAIEEEVDHLYGRLQALEADREFLKHCINSLKKGDKGMDLLQEILQHLRDLRNVDLRVRNLSDGALIMLSEFINGSGLGTEREHQQEDDQMQMLIKF
ncbi:hypothetical protein TEA_016077 [Camellia sinensis var. sinensis]|uniref:GTD-binding domain-containing protein n=1 Tax=Camellia sinensis var. sinensis TaxID=542762 RepID=A0A4S4DJW0_CAMSN|nr:hypothetical protein TEA_016077 [Camellia sinensis var. sinensis]